MTNSKNWIPIEKFLPEKFGFDCNKDVQKLISYIEKEKEAFDYETDDTNKHFIIKIPPVGDIGMAVQNFEAQKFLVYLSRKKIISNLYSPTYVKKKNQKMIQRSITTLYLGDDVALSEAMNKPKEFQKQVTIFKFVNWDEFLKIKLGLKVEKKWEEFVEERQKEGEELMALFQPQEGKNHLQKEVEKRTEEVEKSVVHSPSDSYKILVKDREIWINEYLIGKPHAVGSNFEFFEYIRSQPPNTLIARDKMPNVGDGIGYGYTKEAIKKKGFIKILNELGFKGELLKAFFYKRSKDTLIYRGDKIKKEDLNKAGIKFPLFIKELELAHTKNSPE